MVGKTNLTFISKGEASSVQLVQNSFVTGASGRIYKMEIINNRFFVYVDDGGLNIRHVLSGLDMKNMDFIQKDKAPLQATHIVYADDRYYIMDIKGDKLYATNDFEEYEEVTIPGKQSSGRNVGLFINSMGQIVVSWLRITNNDQKVYINIFVCESLKDISIWHRSLEQEINTPRYVAFVPAERFIADDKIYMEYDNVSSVQVDLSGSCKILDRKLKQYMHVDGYFWCVAYVDDVPRGYSVCRSRDGNTFMSYSYRLSDLDASNFSMARILPIGGKYGLLYKDSTNTWYLNITDDILKIGLAENDKMPVYDDVEVTSILENDGKTYLGTGNGVIYEFQLDYDGMLQRPDVMVIRTMAAKEALAQSLQYTDDCIKELKNYIDEKFCGKEAVEDDSTGVEPTENEG